MSRITRLKVLRSLKSSAKPFSTKVSPNLKHATKIDIIGPPDSVSNLRPIIFAKSRNETDLERKYREAREDTQLWNQRFWTKHNTTFAQERTEFQKGLKDQGKTSVTADDMSIFYKEFLDKNWRTHFKYNIDWYKRNVRLLALELRVRLSKLRFK